jgi:hypothetical protein
MVDFVLFGEKINGGSANVRKRKEIDKAAEAVECLLNQKR